MPTSAWKTASQCRAFLKSPGMSRLESPSKKLSYWRSAVWKANGKDRCATCPYAEGRIRLREMQLSQASPVWKKRADGPSLACDGVGSSPFWLCCHSFCHTWAATRTFREGGCGRRRHGVLGSSFMFLSVI